MGACRRTENGQTNHYLERRQFRPLLSERIGCRKQTADFHSATNVPLFLMESKEMKYRIILELLSAGFQPMLILDALCEIQYRILEIKGIYDIKNTYMIFL